MNLGKIFNLNYLFERFPEAGFSWPIRIVLGILFVGALCLAVYSHQRIKHSSGLNKKVWQKLEIWGWTTGLIGGILVYFREIHTIYLSARIWLLLFILIVFVWLFFIIKYWKTKVPDKEERQKREQQFDKWLPKRK